MEAVIDTSPMTYVVADVAGEPIKGTFYGLELQKVTPLAYFDVEAILDTPYHGNSTQYLIKWASYPDNFNSWESALVRINTDSVTPQQQRRCGRPGRGALSS